MLQLIVNGETRDLVSTGVLVDVLAKLGFQGRFFAVAVNGNFVPRHQYDSFKLEGGENLEVLSPMQGG